MLWVIFPSDQTSAQSTNYPLEVIWRLSESGNEGIFLNLTASFSRNRLFYFFHHECHECLSFKSAIQKNALFYEVSYMGLRVAMGYLNEKIKGLDGKGKDHSSAR